MTTQTALAAEVQSFNSNSRIVVVGTSGSGKSTTAQRLAAILKLRDIELDAFHWEENWRQAELPVFRERVERALETNGGWAIHGNYSKVRDLTFGKSTTVIWLDYPRTIVFWRVIKRTFLRMVRRELLWGKNRESFVTTFFSKDSIILWSIKTYDRNKKLYEKLFASNEYPHLKVMRFKHPRDLDKSLKILEHQLQIHSPKP